MTTPTPPGAPTTPDEVARTINVEAVEEFNAAYPVGTAVLAFPGSRDGRAIPTRTRSTAWHVGKEPVVMVEGYPGGIALTHIEVMPNGLTAAEQKGRGEEGLRERVAAKADFWEEKAGEDSRAWQVFGPQVLSVPFAVAELRALLAASEADRAEGEGHDGHAARLNGLLADCPGCAPATPPTADAEGLSETVIRIGSYVEAGTACTHCRATYWLCSDRVLREPRDPKAWDGCCDQCRDASGHVTRILPGVEGLIAEAVAAAAAPDAGGGAK